jgi:F-type H+-transporting ATPase subunit b
MDFDWTTFALEAVNFLILVWILKHFFYRPVLAVIETRRAESEKNLAQADTLRSEAQSLKDEYANRLDAWERERVATKARLDGEISAARAERLAVLEGEITQERKRREALETRARSDRQHTLERQAVTIAARFAARLLERLAGPELEAKLVDLALSELVTQPPDKLDALRAALREPGVRIKVVTAYPLDETRRSAFARAFSQLASRPVAPSFAEDPILRAGTCVMAGSWVLMANLRDELSFFSEMFDHGE